MNCLSGPAEILHKDWKNAEEQKTVFQADFGVLTPVLTPGKNMQVCWESEAADSAACTKQSIQLEESEETLAQAILQMLNDEVLAEHYRGQALQRAGDFSKERYLEALICCMND